jgi:hypothetical protein
MQYYEISYFHDYLRGMESDKSHLVSITILQSPSLDIVLQWCKYNPNYYQMTSAPADSLYYITSNTKGVHKTVSVKGWSSYHSMEYDAYYFYSIVRLKYDKLDDTKIWKNIVKLDQEKVDQLKQQQDEHKYKIALQEDEVEKLDSDLHQLKKTIKLNKQELLNAYI